jgi:septum formation protein
VLILASASPRRRELLRAIGAELTVRPADIEEVLDAGPLPEAVAALALRKARAVAAKAAGAVVLAADTVVVVDGEPLGKPADAAEARAMLRRLRGRAHEVMTGVAVADTRTGREATAVEVSRVTMAPVTDAAIDAYVATGEPLDKAGAYAVQGLAGAFVAKVEGSYSNVVGLPVETTCRLLEAFGIRLSAAGGSGAPGGRAPGAAARPDPGS